MFLIVTLVLGVLLGWSLGRTSNGMTSPRKAFNLFSGPLAGIICAVLGVIVGLFTADVFGTLVTGFIGGLIGGLIGLGAARLTR